MEGHVSKSNGVDRSVKIQIFQRQFPMVAFQFDASPVGCRNALFAMARDKIPSRDFTLHFLTRSERLDEQVESDSQLYHRCMAAVYLENKVLNVRLVDTSDCMAGKINYAPLGWSDSMNPSKISCIEDWKRETEKIMIKSKDEMNKMVKNAIKEVKKEASKAKKEIKNECVSQILKLAPQENQVVQFSHPATCDICDMSIDGHRFKCTICYDYDLCKKCEAEGKHSQHALLRTVAPAITITPDYILRGFENINDAASNERADKKYEDKWEKLVQKSSLRPKTLESTVVKDGVAVKPAVVDIFANNEKGLLSSAEMMSKLRSAESILKMWREPVYKPLQPPVGTPLPAQQISLPAAQISLPAAQISLPPQKMTAWKPTCQPEWDMTPTYPFVVQPPLSYATKVGNTSDRVEEKNVATLKDKCIRTLGEKYQNALDAQKKETIETSPKVDENELIELTKAVDICSSTDEDDSSSDDDLESLTSDESLEDFTDMEIELSRKALNLPVPSLRPVLNENVAVDEDEGLHTAVAPTPERELHTAIAPTDEEEGLHTAVAPTPEPEENIEDPSESQEGRETQWQRYCAQQRNVLARFYREDPVYSRLFNQPRPETQRRDQADAARQSYWDAIREEARLTALESQAPQRTAMENQVQRNPVDGQNRAPAVNRAQGSNADATASALLEMGFSFTDIQRALANAGINIENCIQFLLHKSF